MSGYFVSVFICNFAAIVFFRLGRAAEMIGSEGKKLGLSVSYPWSSAWKKGEKKNSKRINESIT
jgi:hypothetical protein